MYHGANKKPPFFEGWYFKLISADEKQRYAIILGVILGKDEHAFVQVLNGSTGEASYHRYPLVDFWASEDTFEIQIGPNFFSKHRLKVDIFDGSRQISGETLFEGITPWPVTWTAPGIMGWYAWAPAMETYHGVVSLDHQIQGGLKIDHQPVDFTNGRGYIEKDWGESFPKAWIWFQSNHFDQDGICITASIAIIPWLWSSFGGFIIGLYLQGHLYRFASYTGAKVDALIVSDDHVEWTVSDDRYRLSMTAARSRGGLLKGPTKLDMGKRVDETLLASVQVRLETRQGELVFEGSGRNAGLEVYGDMEELRRQSVAKIRR